MKHHNWPFQKKNIYEKINFMKILFILCLFVISKNAFSQNNYDSFENELKLLENGEIEKEDKLLQNVEAINLLNEMEQSTDDFTDDAVSVGMSGLKREPAIIDKGEISLDSNNVLIIPQKKQRVRSR
jgi:hypothetical protein